MCYHIWWWWLVLGFLEIFILFLFRKNKDLSYELGIHWFSVLLSDHQFLKKKSCLMISIFTFFLSLNSLQIKRQRHWTVWLVKSDVLNKNGQWLIFRPLQKWIKLFFYSRITRSSNMKKYRYAHTMNTVVNLKTFLSFKFYFSWLWITAFCQMLECST